MARSHAGGQQRAQATDIDGDATPFFGADRLARLAPAERAAWTRYLAAASQRRTADQALLGAELRAAGKARMAPAPYRKEFRLTPSMTPAWLAGDEGRRVTATMISFQTPSGGWSKHVDLYGRPRKPGESFYSENDGWHYIATLDNDSTTEQIRFVAAAAAATGDAAARASFTRGLDYLLAAQFPNGCWPQVYPLQGGYHDAITFNDDAILNVMRLLDDVAAGRVKVATPEQQRRAAGAAARGLACIVATQVVDGGVRTIWGQQSDPLTRQPAPARRYELAGLASRESANLVAYLMTLPSPPADVVEAVHAAADWFGKHAITGYDYDVKHGLRADPTGGAALGAAHRARQRAPDLQQPRRRQALRLERAHRSPLRLHLVLPRAGGGAGHLRELGEAASARGAPRARALSVRSDRGAVERFAGSRAAARSR